MNNGENRWWIVGLVAVVLILALVLTLAAAQAQYAEGLAGLFGLVVVGICIIAMLLVVAAVWPGYTARARRNLEAAPGKTFLVGLVNYVFLGAIALVTMNLGAAAVIGLILGAILLAGTFLGLPAAVSLVGARLHSLGEREATRWNEIVAGGATLYLAVWVPVVGWFLLLPALCLWSFGTAALTLVSRRKQEQVKVE